MVGRIHAARYLGASAAVLGMALAASPALAQVQAETEAVDEVVVTGTRIRGETPVGSQLVPVTREDITASSQVTMAQLLQEVPQIFNIGISETSRGQGGNSNISYGSSVNIRGIGPFATLVLVNGHRVVPQGTSGFAVDPSIVPVIGVERVDIVADGASAVYGSDAIAGVANMILRRNIEGFEFTGSYGQGDEYDERQAAIAWGRRWGSGQFSAAFEYSHHSALNGTDRDFFAADLRPRGGADFRTALCAPGNIVVGNVSYAIPAGGVTPATANQLVAGTQNRCDQFKRADLLPKQRHFALDFTFDQDISENVRVFVEGIAHHRKFHLLSGEVRANTFTVPATNAFYVAPPGVTPPPCPASAGVPAGTRCVTVQYAPINDYPQASQNGFSRMVNILFGAEVKLPHEWRGEFVYSWGRNQDEQYANLIAPPANLLTPALASSNPATAFNPFGVNENQDLANSLLVNFSNAKGHSIFQGWEAKFDGPLFSLPGGEVRAAVGYEGQRLTVAQLQILGTFTRKTGEARYFARGVNSFFGEMLVPLFGEGNAMPGFQGLELNLALRHDDYSDVGNTTNPKIGVNWKPVEGLRLHGSWGTSFRAPGIAQIYGNSNNLFLQNIADPTRTGTIQAIYRSGGNLNLKPETAETFSLGLDWDPGFLPGLRVALSYFDIKYENQVTAFLGDLTVLQKESQFAGTGIITRNPSTALIDQQFAETGATILRPNPVLVFIDGRSQNLGITLAEGLDFQVSYRFATDNWGDFAFSAIGTRLFKWDTAITPAAPRIDNLNVIFNSLKFRTRLGARWQMEPWSANLYVNYQNAYRNTLSTPVQTVKAAATIDARVAYNFGDQIAFRDLELALDARNLFDKEPPFVNIAQSANGGGGFDPTRLSAIGRVVSVSLSGKF